MATSPNYGWSEPDNSSLVKNGAADIRTLGDAIDTSVWNVGFGQAAKNKIINGNFSVNQRQFTSTTTAGYSIFDRWLFFYLGGTQTVSSQAFTSGAAPVAGYEGSNYCRNVTSGFAYSATDYAYLSQRVEDVRNFAGQTATLSFWAKSGAGTPKVGIQVGQNFGTGGSPSAAVNTYASPVTISTSWTRYSVTIAIPSISGKTIGTDVNSSHLRVYLWFEAGTNNSSVGITAAQNNTFDIWGVQVEAGSTATPFQTATGTIQGELAACQRYYYNSLGQNQIMGINTNSTTTILTARPPVTMRTSPSLTVPSSGSIDSYQDGAKTSASAPAGVYLSDSLAVIASVGYTGLTVGSTSTWRLTTAFQLSAEL